jgi:hypothetical protein
MKEVKFYSGNVPTSAKKQAVSHQPYPASYSFVLFMAYYLTWMQQQNLRKKKEKKKADLYDSDDDLKNNIEYEQAIMQVDAMMDRYETKGVSS